ncbi:MAG: hypothetical protein NT081_07265 [Actinobacteria bacterium]|nr:hypothetical protein [Actinomycetota bacterium]
MTDSTPPPPQPPTPEPTRPRSPWKTITVVVLVALLSIPVLSLGRAVLTPNSLTVTERAAEWMRDNNMGFILNNIESWWFSHHAPKAGGEPNRTIDVASTTGPTTPAGILHLAKPANVDVPEGVAPVANEGVWSPVGPQVDGAQTMYTTQVRPDSVHTSILDGLVWMDPKLVKFEVHPGTEEPGGKQTVPAQVPLDRRLDLIAAFNGGFRMQDAMGGFYLDGVTYKPLRDGAASLVTYADGVAGVGVWGRDFEMSPNVVAVRQNLDLIIDNGGGFPFPGGNPSPKDKAEPGEPAEGLDNNQNGAWGYTVGNKVLVWRSAVGVTASGALVYGYGSGLGARSLADLMLRAGCVRAMELDINTAWTTMNFYKAATPGNAATVKGIKLLPDSEKSGNRYLSNDPRDFVAVFVRKI